jgi:hypothetical protein
LCHDTPTICSGFSGSIFLLAMKRNDINYSKRIEAIYDVYVSTKQYDIPDTMIVKKYFPKHNIYISYQTLMRIKKLKQKELNIQ